MANFPTSPTTFTARNTGDTIQPGHVNDLQDEVNAVEAGYLQGSARLNSSNSTLANLNVTGNSTFKGGMQSSNSTMVNLNVTGGSTFAAMTFTSTLTAQGAIYFTGVISPAAITGQQNNWNPTGISSAAMVRIDASAASTIGGISGGADGRLLYVRPLSTLITFAHADTGSSAETRFFIGGGAYVPASSREIMMLFYDGTSSRWHIMRSAV